MPGRKVFDFVVIWFSWALAAILISNNTLSLFPAFFFSFLVLLAIILMFKYLTPIDDGPSYEPNLKEDLFAMGKVFFALYCILGFAIIVSSAFTIVGMATISHLAEIEMPKEGVGFTRDEGRVIFLLPPPAFPARE